MGPPRIRQNIVHVYICLFFPKWIPSFSRSSKESTKQRSFFSPIYWTNIFWVPVMSQQFFKALMMPELLQVCPPVEMYTLYAFLIANITVCVHMVKQMPSSDIKFTILAYPKLIWIWNNIQFFPSQMRVFFRHLSV